MKDVKLSEVARLAGVSPGTVSNAFNRPSVVAPETLERVMAAVAALNYVPNGAARQLRVGTNSTIGILLHDLKNPFFADLGEGAEMRAAEHGFSTLIATSNGSGEKQRDYLALFEEQRVHGVLLQPNDFPAAALDQLRSRGIPVVLLDPAPDGSDVTSVSGDDLEGGRMAARHLIECGRRRVAMVSGPLEERAFAERWEGAREEFERAGVEVLPMPSDATIQAGRAAGESIIADGGFDAVFAGNDILALGVLHALRVAEIEVPDRVAVLGYDDIEISRAAIVPLSSMRQPAGEMGRVAVQMLFDQIEGREPEQTRVVFTPKLVARSSTVG
ncbi:LacI family DNA-binding transcriptional regulator [Homoserinibacter sp. GY 40078]|uniref:LacI family DNA-binding transcriptional regulator n=1 Tax=Homoserinibacter sp. GY 40078 TaxID=2603275 RepID=UPI0011CB72AC|nr:LacI family DNA-binding transcriptional regulator [Homoserinibacter sp. GY 40078]TXK18482.1 LacI family transcriptional regulator [Homoserinibacter sp. GY 40078]